MAIIWQSSWFWLALCSLLFIILGYTVLTPSPTTSYASENHTIILASTDFPTLIPTDRAPIPSPIDFPIFVRQPDRRSPNTPPQNQDILIDSPQCYGITQESYSCIGQIWNTGETVIGDTTLQIEIQEQDEDKSYTQTFAIEQRIIASGEAAPYRILLNNQAIDRHWDAYINDSDDVDNDNENFSENETSEYTITQIDNRNHQQDEETIASSFLDLATSNLFLSLANTLPPSPNMRELSIVSSAGSISASGSYTLVVTIANDTEDIVEDLRVVTMLSGDEWGMVGYNVYEVGDILTIGQRRTIELSIIPHALPDIIHHNLHVEANIKQ